MRQEGPTRPPPTVPEGYDSSGDRSKTPEIASRRPQGPPRRPKKPPGGVPRGPQEARVVPFPRENVYV
eukprot:7778986-Pyramimonas_sp.AAC.1